MPSTYLRNLLKQLLIPLAALLLLLHCQTTFAQSKPPIQWTRFNLLSADTIWKYQGGIANSEYFEPAFDDQRWQTVSTDFVTVLSENKSTWPGNGVFRKKFNVPDSLRGTRVELITLMQNGASAIYFDGKLVYGFGNISSSEKEEKIYLITPVTEPPPKPVQIELDNQSSHVIAIYFSNHDQGGIAKFGFRGFMLMLSPLTDLTGDAGDLFPHFMISLFIVVTFCLFFCCVYGFYPYRLASLLSAIYLANFSLIFAGAAFRDSSTDIDRAIAGQNIWQFAFSCHFGWGVLFLYSIYYNRIPKRSWIIAGLMCACVALIFFRPSLWSNFTNVVIILFQLESWRILILGLRKKRTGFLILAIGWFLTIIGTLVAIFDVFHLFPWYLTTTQTVLATANDMSIPLTLALQFAWEFGSANRDLRRQLANVNDLSKKNLEQEQEKQQILSMQNETLEQQVLERTSEVVAKNKEIESQRDQVTKTLDELRSTQTQLIQSEKMASLGELTAGIAHEIQNPLNFVNNFSEVNTELIDELKTEIDAGNISQLKTIASDLGQNMEKITHHGKRADAIVKGMLQHSRKSTGQKELTDINTLADEYLRLSYHGLRAKDKSFNATIKTDFDPSLEKINVVPQDIGRALLNLFNNAFYAVTEKNKISADHFDPIVSVSTKKLNGKLEITVMDNGTGIPQKIADKIFQPFFTTKPTGQGTGLGLSLSYDIITKEHGGQIKLDTKENEYTIFSIQLPL